MVSDHGLGRGPDHGVGVDPESVSNVIILGPNGCEQGSPLQKCKTPNPSKVIGRVLEEVPARNGVLGEVLGKVLAPYVSEHFWGVGGFALL